jgi:hypothetical protein
MVITTLIAQAWKQSKKEDEIAMYRRWYMKSDQKIEQLKKMLPREPYG